MGISLYKNTKLKMVKHEYYEIDEDGSEIHHQIGLCDVWLGLIFPWALVCKHKGCGMETFITVALCFAFYIPAVIYAFWKVEEIPFCHNMMCTFLPPFALLARKGECDAQVCVCAL